MKLSFACGSFLGVVLSAALFSLAHSVKYEWGSAECQALDARLKAEAAPPPPKPTCLSECVEDGSVALDEPCLNSDMCADQGYCSSSWKICSLNYRSVSWSIPKAYCTNCSWDQDNYNNCQCEEDNFPNQWVKCTNSDQYETCDMSRIPEPEPEYQYEPNWIHFTRTGKPRCLSEDDDFAVAQLCYHNKFRQQAGLAPLQWDKAIANFARKYASTLEGLCAMKHSSSEERRNFSARWDSMGENIYNHRCRLAFSPNEWPTKGADSVKAWYSEMKFYQYAGEHGGYDNSSQSGCPFREPKFPTGDALQTGHMTQVMWNTTTHLGCHYALCLKTYPPSTVEYNYKIVLCNYGPTGNMGMWQQIDGEWVVVTYPMFKPENFCKINANPETEQLYGEVPQCKGSPIDCSQYA